MPAAELPIVAATEPIFRLARKPDPWRPPDWAYANEDRTFGNRFDDFEGYFRVLYASSSRLGCFVETLARFRRPVDPELQQATDSDFDHIAAGTVPASWLSKRSMGRATMSDARFANVYHSQWVSFLREQFERELVDSEPFDMAVLMSQRRSLTQRISTLICSLGYDGIFYQSRHGADLWNWAVYEPFERLRPLETSELVLEDDDLRPALKRLDLVIDVTK